jgi:putative Mg2+ transporter-C (MgtC) family protein
LVFETLPTGYELRFLADIGIALAAGFAIGAERESRGKPAGISTHCLVIGGTAIFTFLSSVAASIGMAIGYEYYFMAAVATAFAVGVPRIPHISKLIKKGEED